MTAGLYLTNTAVNACYNGPATWTQASSTRSVTESASKMEPTMIVPSGNQTNITFPVTDFMSILSSEHRIGASSTAITPVIDNMAIHYQHTSIWLMFFCFQILIPCLN